MPLHWIYNTDSIAKKVGAGNPEFYPKPSCMFYSYKLGAQTPYGQQSAVLLQTVSSNVNTSFDALEYMTAYHAFYSPGGACYTDIWNGTMLHDLCYHDGSTKGFMENIDKDGKSWPECGANDTQANAIAHMPIIVARYAGDPKMLSIVADAIRVTQNTDEAVAFGLAGARILENVILGKSTTGLLAVKAVIAELLNSTRTHPMPQDADLAHRLQDVLQKLDTPNIEVVKSIGQACDYPFNLISGSHLIAQVGDGGSAGYVNGTRQTILAGGDNGSRNMFVGAVLGALAPESIPTDWKKKTTGLATVQAQAVGLAAMCCGSGL